MDKNQENKQGKTKEFFSSAWKKTADFGKKTAGEIQKSAKSFSEQREKKAQDRLKAKEEPITLEMYKSKDFHIPNIIVIIDDAEKRGQFLYKDAIGYRKKLKANSQEVEVFYLFDENVKDLDLEFVPFPNCDEIYCTYPFDKSRFINATDVFEKTTSEKTAELEHIAYSLGAKSYSIEIIEKNKTHSHADASLGVNANTPNIEEASANATTNTEFHHRQENSSKQSATIIGKFDSTRAPKMPELKWFAYDDGIKNLIEMRCSEKPETGSRKVELSGSSAKAMSLKVACAIDIIAKESGNITNMNASFSMEKKAVEEHDKFLRFIVEF